jgi:hypothetical protein
LDLPVYRLRDLFRSFRNVVNSAPWQDDARKRAITIGAPFIATGCVEFVRLDAARNLSLRLSFIAPSSDCTRLGVRKGTPSNAPSAASISSTGTAW